MEVNNVKNNEDQVAAELERDAANPDAWERDAASISLSERRSLGTQVSLRLNPHNADELRRIARIKGVGYTSLLRSWIEDRLRAETQRPWAGGVTVNRFESAITMVQAPTAFDVGDPMKSRIVQTR